jgi:hypothetical protein
MRYLARSPVGFIVRELLISLKNRTQLFSIHLLGAPVASPPWSRFPQGGALADPRAMPFAYQRRHGLGSMGVAGSPERAFPTTADGFDSRYLQGHLVCANNPHIPHLTHNAVDTLICECHSMTIHLTPNPPTPACHAVASLYSYGSALSKG